MKQKFSTLLASTKQYAVQLFSETQRPVDSESKVLFTRCGSYYRLHQL